MNPRLLLPLAGSVLLALAAQVSSSELEYLDDRSSPERLIHSLYNAVSRGEYARAYSYFGTPPDKTLEEYAAGYENTESVNVLTGTARAEGAAGSIFYSLPVAILASSKDGEEQVFAGCYRLRLVQPSVQTTSFTPLMIESGRLKPAEGTLADALPASCGEGTPEPRDQLLQRAEKVFNTVYGSTCSEDDAGSEDLPESHVIRFNHDYDSADTPPTEVRLFRFFCGRGAYNEIHVYLLANENKEVLPLRFAVPELDIHYENGNADGRVEEVRVVGFQTQDQLINSEFDLETLTLTTHGKWRGIGDASSNGQWIFRSGAFSLVRYDVDASYDGEINPETVLDYVTGP